MRPDSVFDPGWTGDAIGNGARHLGDLGERWVLALMELAYLRLPVEVLATVTGQIGSGRLPVGAALLVSREVLLPVREGPKGGGGEEGGAGRDIASMGLLALLP